MRHLRLTVPMLAVATAAAVATADAAGARAPLYWRSGPASGARIALEPGRAAHFRIEAAAGNRRERVTLSLLGRSPARLRTRAGNPAVGTVRLSAAAARPGAAIAVTVVARSAGKRPLEIARTVVLVVRTRPVSLVGPGTVSRWAYVLEPEPARAAPSRRARVVAQVPTSTSDAQPNLVGVLAQQEDARGTLWVHVRLTALPNGRTGWVPRSSLSPYRAVAARLLVNTHRFTLTLTVRGRAVFRARVGVGRAGSPTPRGVFYIREKLVRFHSPFYGPVAFGTSARSPTLTDWPGGGIVGIHGTNAPGLIPGRISHGCIRLRNADILRLARLLPLGTPLVIR